MSDMNKLESALNEKLEKLSRLWKKKDADSILDEIYTPNAEISGNDLSEVVNGPESLHALVSGLLEGSTEAKITIVKSKLLNDHAIYTWVNWDVTLNDTSSFTMKSLFIWTLENDDWKIIADMYAEGYLEG